MSTLEKLYSDLDFRNGDLFPVADTPDKLRKNVWLEKGEWLSAAKRARAEKLFFVENNPVAVFAECGEGHAEKFKSFNRIWSLARPRLLFLASPGEITVYDLAQKPFNSSGETKKQNELKALATLDDIEKVAQELQNFHRDNIESGRIFEIEKGRFGDLNNRADKSLIRDLKTVRRELIQAGLDGENVKYAHALIGRSIFIRYLEDRQILTEDYFRKVSRQTAGWTEILKTESPSIASDFSEKKTFYPRVLSNKDFTYALFRSLARDFNGDMFPDVDTEETIVEPIHLNLIQDLLYGEVGIQKKLFFYSYRFDIIPLDLISSIYEEFYHFSTSDDEKKSKARHDGAFYTPPALVEFVLSRTLTAEELKKAPRVLDPACGSGTFLVEAFRRIVRHKQYEKQGPLSFDELKEILQKQIAGIEVNKEAARIAAFSLYLSMLHYLDPPSINEQIKQGNKLPNLISTESCSQNDYHCIWPDNVFKVDAIQSNALWNERFGDQCANVIVGNPPWGAPGDKADEAAKDRERIMLEWCRKKKHPIGDKEPSQAFLWRALDFLKGGGKAAMLVSAGVLFKHRGTNQAFRKEWVSSVRLEEIFNFTHVRKFFFKETDSPFIVICFTKGKQNGAAVTYASAKQVTALKETQTVVFSKYDSHFLRDENLTCSKLWKSYWFGRFADYEFIKKLQQNPPLASLLNDTKACRGRGYQTYTVKHDGRKLGVSKTVKKFSDRYGLLEFLPLPPKVYNLGPTECYQGNRLLINEGIRIHKKEEPQGWIIARFENEPFSFSRSIYGVKLPSSDPQEYKILVGILWSSLPRYYFFSTSANWGLWHNKLLFDELMQFPVVLDKGNPATAKITSIVDSLHGYHPQRWSIIYPDGVPEEEIKATRQKWESELDEAVFELYGLNEEQKDLIRDCCEVTLPFFYKPFDSVGAMPAVEGDDLSWVETYIRIFARRWNVYLRDDEEMRAEIHTGAHDNMLAVEFFPADKDDSWNLKPKNDSWEHILDRIGKALPQSMGTSQIVLDGLVHVISDDGIIIIKRNEKRFWTRSLAREDADVTLCKAMQKEERDS